MRSLTRTTLAVAGWSLAVFGLAAVPAAHAFQDAASKPAATETEAKPEGKEAGEKKSDMKLESAPSTRAYKGVSHFFNIREANSNTEKGELEFELTYGYSTKSGESDENELSQSIKYGLSDRAYIELEVEEPLGEGGEGAGELYLTYFRTYIEEQDWLPAFANSIVLRIPTGVGSSGVDATFNFIFTKTIVDGFRVHLNGFVQTANGEPGEFDDDEDRMDFQWGVGPGFDLKLTDSTLGVLNYLHRSSEIEGKHNQNILELGVVQKLPNLAENIAHELKLSSTIGLDGNDNTPNWGFKVQWGLGLH